MHSITITLADLFYVEHVGLAMSMTSHLLDGVRFLDALEQLHLTDIHFVFYPQLTSCMNACGIDGKCFQTTLFHLYLYLIFVRFDSLRPINNRSVI